MSSRFLSHFQTFYVGFPCRGCLLKPIPFGATFTQEKYGKKNKRRRRQQQKQKSLLTRSKFLLVATAGILNETFVNAI